MYTITHQLHQQTNKAITSALLNTCKRDAVIFFIFMSLLVIIIDPISITPRAYSDFITLAFNGDGNNVGMQTYSLYVFYCVSSHISFNLMVTCYLSVLMLFISLTLAQTNVYQQGMLSHVDTDTFKLEHYHSARDKIRNLLNDSYYSLQLATMTALVNIISFMFLLWRDHFTA
jgi:hypothetical protein